MGFKRLGYIDRQKRLKRHSFNRARTRGNDKKEKGTLFFGRKVFVVEKVSGKRRMPGKKTILLVLGVPTPLLEMVHSSYIAVFIEKERPV